MIRLTENTIEGVRKLRIKKNIDTSYKLRVGIQIGGCAGYTYYVGFDNIKENDVEFMQSDICIIADKVHLTFFNGLEIDYVDQEYGGFIFKNPLAKKVCGCGTSFNTKDKTENSTNAQQGICESRADGSN
ncbi:MAG: iron-sulfur cluster assembly accessory protein [Bacteroidetes bacterium]|nr:iron-sulfur cluster assembly accessory protein [Bacteroidota bacterium]